MQRKLIVLVLVVAIIVMSVSQLSAAGSVTLEGLASALAALTQDFQDLRKNVETIEASLADMTPGLAARVEAIEASLADMTPGLAARVEAIEAASEIKAASMSAPAVALVNVRSGPGTSYLIIGVVERGHSITATGRNQDGDWVQFSYQGNIGWIYAPLITVENPDELPVISAPPSP